MRILAHIPGQPPERLPMPAGAVDAALAALRALDDKLSNAALFGFLEPRLTPTWDVYHQHLSVAVHRELCWSYRAGLSIAWTWGVRWRDDDGWYEPGWVADNCAWALTPQARHQMWRALNPDG